MVVPLRLACIASGGAKGKAEARRMFDEKVDAHQDLVSKLGAGGFGTDVPKMASGVLRHYLVRVRANRKRLVSELIG